MKKLIIQLMIGLLCCSYAEAQIQFHQPVAKEKKEKKAKKKKEKKASKSVLFRNDGTFEAVEVSETEPVLTVKASDLDKNNNQVTEIKASDLPGSDKSQQAAPAYTPSQTPAYTPARPQGQTPQNTVMPVRRPLPASGLQDVRTVSVILPFNLNSTSTAEDKKQMRAVEFYQGFLMGVDEAQKRGQNIEVHTFDIGSLNLSNILNNEGLQRSDAIIAPMESEEIERVAKFAEERGIAVISPFKFCKNLTDGYPHLMQLNTSKTTLYDKLSQDLAARFSNYTVVFVKDSLFANQTDAYPQNLKAQLKRNGTEFFEYTYNDPHSVASMDSALNLSGRNIFYVLETPQRDALRRFFPSLKNKLFLDANPSTAEAIGATYTTGDELLPQYTVVANEAEADSLRQIAKQRQVAILGYPEWQLLTSDFMEYFYDLNVWMFSQFYVNPFEEKVQQFQTDFKYWYSRELMAIYPKYGIYGYDVANFVFGHLQYKQGDWAMDFSNLSGRTLQTDIHLERESENGCLMNRGLYLVHFTPETTIEKFEIR